MCYQMTWKIQMRFIVESCELAVRSTRFCSHMSQFERRGDPYFGGFTGHSGKNYVRLVLVAICSTCPTISASGQWKDEVVGATCITKN